MNTDAWREAYREELDKLRRQPLQIDGLAVARIARKVGMPPSEALREMRRRVFLEHEKGLEACDVLEAFVSALYRLLKPVRMLEYTCVPSILTAGIAESSKPRNITYVIPERTLAESVSVLVGTTDVSILNTIEELEANERFDFVVCQPPIGNRSSGVDGFGGEAVRRLASNIAEGGTLLWLTARASISNERSKRTLSELERNGLNPTAFIDISPGALAGTMIEGVVIALRRAVTTQRFTGAVRDLEAAEHMAAAFSAGPSRKTGPSWMWLDLDDQRSFSQIEQGRLLQKLTPRGHHERRSLGSLLANDRVERADRPLPDQLTEASFLFIPEYLASRVTADMEDQTVNARAVYRLEISTSKANPRFLARLLNSPYGKALRASIAEGSAIQRTSLKNLLALEMPVPDLHTQDRIARIDGDIGLLQSSTRDLQSTLEQDWSALPEVAEKIDRLKAVLDIERQIADWWRELPYPLATIYRRYQVSTDSKERLESLLHFFELAAVFLAAVGSSHVRAMRRDWKEVMAKWLHPSAGAGIERADFGFWIHLANASLKDTMRIASDKELCAIATEIAGPELVQVGRTLGPIGKATEVLDVARRYRNAFKGHGGHMKASDAARLDSELQQQVRDLYEVLSGVFRRILLVRPGMAEVTDQYMRYEVQKLRGSDPTFERETIELTRPARSSALAFWMRGTRSVCRALPFFRLGAPQQPQETSFYVFNRVDKGGFRWISYQEAREQEFTAPDEELSDIINEVARG